MQVVPSHTCEQAVPVHSWLIGTRMAVADRLLGALPTSKTKLVTPEVFISTALAIVAGLTPATGAQLPGVPGAGKVVVRAQVSMAVKVWHMALTPAALFPAVQAPRTSESLAAVADVRSSPLRMALSDPSYCTT